MKACMRQSSINRYRYQYSIKGLPWLLSDPKWTKQKSRSRAESRFDRDSNWWRDG